MYSFSYRMRCFRKKSERTIVLGFAMKHLFRNINNGCSINPLPIPKALLEIFSPKIFIQVPQTVMLGSVSIMECWIFNLSGCMISSASIRAIYLPVAIFIPIFRDAMKSCLFSTKRIRLSSYERIVSFVPSVEPSSTIIHSKSVKD